MKLSIYTIQNLLFSGEIKKLIARTPSGEITVLDNHIPLISTVNGPAITIVDNEEKSQTIELASGFLEVRPESEVVILAQQ